MRVLIIEDDSIVAMHIERTIAFYNHDVVKVVSNGADALNVAKLQQLDLVVSDINIEGELDGIETCKILQQEYGVAVILISAYNDIHTLQNASTLNFIGYLIKPFREDELMTLLDLVVLRKQNLPNESRDIINRHYSYCGKYKTLYKNDEMVELTHKENNFLDALLKTKGAILPYSFFASMVWEGEDITDDARRQMIYRFRQKLPDFPLKLIKGVGYKLDTE